MLLYDFLKKVEEFNLPVSFGLDLASYILNVSYEDVKSLYYTDIDDNKVEQVFSQLKDHIPVAYITGRKEFYGREFLVDENVLIPRVETEILVEEVLKRYNNHSNLDIIDICSGSGTIGLTIIQEIANCHMTLLDISPKAIDISKKNAEKFNIKNNIEYICDDILLYTSDKKYDIVLCNPPYISFEEYAGLEEEVKKEPVIALTADDNGLLFYKNILSKFPILCKNSGVMFFEIGAAQADDVKKIAENNNLYAECIKDYSLNDRVIIVHS